MKRIKPRTSNATKQRVILDAQLVGMQALQQSLEAMRVMLDSAALIAQAGATVINSQVQTQQAIAEALKAKAGPRQTLTVRNLEGFTAEAWEGPKEE